MPKGDMFHYKYTGCGNMDLTSVCQLPGLKELFDYVDKPIVQWEKVFKVYHF